MEASSKCLTSIAKCAIIWREYKVILTHSKHIAVSEMQLNEPIKTLPLITKNSLVSGFHNKLILYIKD